MGMAPQRWCVPERRDGIHLLAPLPAEIYLLIFDEIPYEPEIQSLASYKSTLSNLTLVCRFFAAVITRKLYNHFVFDGSSFTDEGTHSPQARWLDNLDERNENSCELAKHVKEVTFLQWRDPMDPGEWKSTPSRDRYLRALPCFINMNSFTITRCPIPLEFFDAVMALQGLKVLRVKDCVFEEVDEAVEFMEPDATNLVHVEISCASNFRYYRKALADLVATSSLRFLKTTHWRFAKAILHKNTDMFLEHLDIPLVAKGCSILSDFLNRTPTIKDLALVSDPDTESGDVPEPALSIDSKALPNLRTLRCPSYLLSIFCPGRPLEKLNLVESQDWLWPRTCEANEISLLKNEKTHRLCRVDVSISMYHAIKLREYLPRIDTLCVCFPYLVSTIPCRDVVKAFCSMHDQPPTIRRLKLQFFGGINIMWAFDLTFQKLLLEDLSKTFTSVTTICLSDGLEWQLDPTDKSVWKPVLEMPEFYRSLLLASDELFWKLAKVRDPDGVFAGLFMDEELSGELKKQLGLSGDRADCLQDEEIDPGDKLRAMARLVASSE